MTSGESRKPLSADEQLAELRDELHALRKHVGEQAAQLDRLREQSKQHDAGLRELRKSLQDILRSRIWRTLVTAGGFVLNPVAALRGRKKAGDASRSSPDVALHCDYPNPHWRQSLSGKILVRGWAIAKKGVNKVEVQVGDGPLVTARYGVPRPDVGALFSGFKESSLCGFQAPVDLSALPEGPKAIRIIVHAANGARRSLEVNFQVDRRAGADARTATEAAQLARAIQRKPLISVITPVYNTPEQWLRRCIDSVRSQQYENWELCIADDHSSEPHVRNVLEEYSRRDSRIAVAYRTANGHIAEASNTALALAKGDYIALLDHDDELTPDALLETALACNINPDVDMIYSDEDKIDEEGYCWDPFYKPDWSPEYFLSCMYTCHLGVYRRSLVHEVGGFRPEVTGAQDYDLALRITSRTNRIHHIPKVLYHWRTLPTSTALDADAKDYAHTAAANALRHYLCLRSTPADVLPGPSKGFHRVRFAISGRPRVSIVIPSAGRMIQYEGRSMDLLRNCVESIVRKSTWANYEIIAVDNGDLRPGLSAFLDSLGVRRVTYSAVPFNLAQKMNLGAQNASGEHLVFLNDDIEVISPDWIEAMLEFSQQDGIGAVGAKLLFPSNRIQHAGVVILNGLPGHPYYDHPAEDAGYYRSAQVARNYLAVTGACMMTKMALFRSLEGFDEDFPLNYNDVDYCLRLHDRGERSVYTPHAELYHYESVSRENPRAVGDDEVLVFEEKWKDRYFLDPYYNPNLPADILYYRVE